MPPVSPGCAVCCMGAAAVSAGVSVGRSASGAEIQEHPAKSGNAIDAVNASIRFHNLSFICVLYDGKEKYANPHILCYDMPILEAEYVQFYE